VQTGGKWAAGGSSRGNNGEKMEVKEEEDFYVRESLTRISFNKMLLPCP
jgi:hypothetical protein